MEQMMMFMKFLFVFLWVFITAVTAHAQAQEVEIRDVSVAKFKSAMDSLDGEVLIDLRTPEELEKGKIPGAIVIDFFGSDFEPAIAALDKSKVYLLYCAAGGRSGETAELMSKMGFRKIYNLESGFNGWVKEKMPVERK